MSVTFSVIVPTKGRETLTRTLASVAPQLEHGDELLVRRLDCEFGNEARDDMIAKATGSHLLFMDDDDVYTEGAFAVIREAVTLEPDRMHIFKMQHGDDNFLWAAPRFGIGMIGTPMVVVPNGNVSHWSGKGYEADFRFFDATLKLIGGTPHFHEHVIAVVRP